MRKSPSVVPEVSYPDMRFWQQSGVRLRGQSNHNPKCERRKRRCIPQRPGARNKTGMGNINWTIEEFVMME